MAGATILTCDWITEPENQAPYAVGTIPDQIVEVDSTVLVDPVTHFADPDGDTLTYTAVSTDPAMAAATVSGSMLTVTGVAAGQTSMTVTARDPEGLTATQSFAVTVPNRAPEAVSMIEDRELEVDSVLTVEVVPYFMDPDRDSLEYLAASSDSTRAAVAVSGSALTVTGVAKGGATVTVTARDPGGLEAEQSFGVTVPNRPPEAVGTIEDRELYVGDAVEIDVAAHFTDPDGEELEYAVASSDTARAAVRVSGGMVTVTGAAVGSATLTVTARDPEGLSAEQAFAVKVPNRAPEPHGTIADRDIYVGDTVAVDIVAYFAEPDGEELEYAAVSASAATATVAVSGSTLTVAAVAVGSTTVTVTAQDPHGLWAEQSFAVTVPSRAPSRVGRIADREVKVDSVVVVEVANRFTEPDGEELEYSATSSDITRVVVAMSGSRLTVTGVAKGGATVTVTAVDPGGLAAEQSFGVTVPNRPPEAVGTIEDRELYVGDAVEIDVAAHFTDPDGDELEYAVASSDTARAAVGVSGGMVTVTGAAVGSATLTVTARDPEGLSAEQAFAVKVPNRAPEPHGTIADRDIYVGDTVAVDIVAYFAEPDGEELEYAAVSASAATATVAVSGSTLTVAAVAVGSTTVTVTAQDPHGLWAEQSFAVTVPSRAPSRVGRIADREVKVDSVVVVEVANRFTEPDGEELEYSATSSDITRVVVAMSGSRLTVTGVAKGTATVTVTAVDPGGLAAEQSFGVTVPNRPPEAVGTIEDRELYVGDAVEIDVAAHFTDPDGDELEYAVASSDTARAAVGVSGGMVTVTGAAVGSATLTVTARDPEGLSAEQAFAVKVPNRAPEPHGTIADRDIYVGDTVAVDIVAYFAEPDGEELEYAAVSASAATATVAVSGSTLTVAAVAVGSTTVTVTAQDPHGLWAEQSFAVTVPSRAPSRVGRIADREVKVDSVVVVEVANRFTEPDGEELEYSATSSDITRVVVAMSGSRLTVTGVAKGTATVTVTAVDPGGLAAEQSFGVSVPNRAPEAVGTIADRVVRAGSSATVDVAANFTDLDGDALRYFATSSDPARVSVSVSGSVVTVTGVAGGSATVTVTARDSAGLSARRRFHVTVPNRTPEAVGTVGNRAVERNKSFSLDVSPYFSDPDDDDLTHIATSSSTARVTVSLSGSTLTITGEGVGTATITVTATDPGGLSATQSFRVRVVQGNRTPRPVGTIPDASFAAGNTLSVNVSQYFSDPDGDALDYSANSSNPTVATASVSGTTLTVSGVDEGDATITVRATDPGGLSTTQRFDVTVAPAPPSDLVVEPPSANPNVLGPGESFTLSAVVHNRGAGSASSGTALRYYRSDDATIGTGDTQIGTDAVPLLGPSEVSAQSLPVTAPSGFGTYYYGACADIVDNESDTGNNCSSAVVVEVTQANRSPRAVGTIPDQSAEVGDTVSVDVEPYFNDPDGDALTYAAASSNTGAARVTRSGSTVTVTAVAAGDATITVTATDTGGLSATQHFDVKVQAAAESDLVVLTPAANPDALGPSETFTLSAVVHNQGAGGASSSTTLRYYRSSDATIGTGDTQIGTDAVAQLGPSQSSPESLPVTAPSGQGTYYYGACADAVSNESDTGNNCSSAVEVNVAQPNQAPRPVGTIPDETVPVGDEVSVDAEPYFMDPDGDDLDYTAASSSTAVATVIVSGSDIEVKGQDEGDATITVTATDPGGLRATQSFEVKVEDLPNQTPFVADELADFVATPGESYRAYLPDVFTDPDGDALSWSTSSSNSAAAESSISGDSIIVNAVAVGSATVSVTATDPEGLSATDEFEVEVFAARFDMDLLFTSDITDSQRSRIRQARDRWKSTLANTELNNVRLPSTVGCLGLTATSIGTVDDHLTLVGERAIDGVGGVLAEATYCFVRTSDGTPVISAIVFDEADIDLVAALGSLVGVAFHEFAHGLGFYNAYWEDHNLVDTVADPHFTGALAIEAFDAAGGTAYTDAKVAISSPDYNHWREAVLGREGMTPNFTQGAANPFSAITLQAMADVGYVVDVSLADDYQLPNAVPPDGPAQVFDLTGDVVRGPVMIIDTDGRIVRVVPPPPGSVLPSFRRKEVRIDRRDSDGPGTWKRSPSRQGPPRR